MITVTITVAHSLIPRPFPPPVFDTVSDQILAVGMAWNEAILYSPTLEMGCYLKLLNETENRMCIYEWE